MTDTTTQHSITLDDSHTNKRIDAVLGALLPQYSRTQLQSWIKSGQVLINNKTVKPNYKVSGFETIIVNAQPRPVLESKPQEIPLDIVHEEDDFLIINKPVGLVVHPGAGNPESTLLNALLHHAPALKNLPRAGIVHRIDKDTSGLLIIAKTEGALMSLANQIKEHSVAREYQTVVSGNIISGGTIDKPIGRHPRDRKRMAVSESGKSAITHYRVSERYRNHTRLKVNLETGRTHQIRVHLAHIKHPIVGDKTYAGRAKLGKGMSEELIGLIRGFKRQALHAFALTFEHPKTGENVRYECELPEDIKELITALKADKEDQ